jgi:hypothetical protein
LKQERNSVLRGRRGKKERIFGGVEVKVKWLFTSSKSSKGASSCCLRCFPRFGEGMVSVETGKRKQLESRKYSVSWRSVRRNKGTTDEENDNQTIEDLIVERMESLFLAFTDTKRNDWRNLSTLVTVTNHPKKTETEKMMLMILCLNLWNGNNVFKFCFEVVRKSGHQNKVSYFHKKSF